MAVVVVEGQSGRRLIETPEHVNAMQRLRVPG